MATIFSKNGILSSRMDYYCLICAEQFGSEEDTLAHVVDPHHKKNLNTCGYFEKYKEDFIKKAQGLYFCEICSLTFPTSKKVELHIREPSHVKEYNEIYPVKRVEKDIIAFNQFFISDDAWNACVEDTCWLCNTEFDDSASHKATQSHILNLIKSEVIFDKILKTAVRLIDTTTRHCLTCNVIVGNPIDHFNTTEHKEAYKIYDHGSQTNGALHGKNINALSETNMQTIIKKEDNKDAIKVNNGNVIANGNEHSKLDAKKNNKKQTNEKSDKEKHKQAKKKSAEELDKIYCKNLGAKNYVKEGPLGDRWCLLCEQMVDVQVTTERHIQGKHHKNLLKLHNERIKNMSDESDAIKDEKSIYESVDRYQKNSVNIDLINETAYCKKCSKNISFNTDAIDRHIEDHKNTPKKKSQGSVSFTSGINSDGTDRTMLFTKPVLMTANKGPQPSVVKVEDFAKQHGLSHNRADRSYYCRPCTRRLPNSLEALKTHVASKIHTENNRESTKADQIQTPIKKPIIDFVKFFGFTQNSNEIIIVINDKYWLNAFGFYLIAKKNNRIFCHGCDIDLVTENVMEHIALSSYHGDILDNNRVVASLENEFIREIKLDVYHCGYCNIHENDWDDIIDHIATPEHKLERSKAELCLRNNTDCYRRVTLKEAKEMLDLFNRMNMRF